MFLHKMAVVCLTVSAAFAETSSYRLTLYEKGSLAGTELKPGDYKVEVNGNRATFINGKQRIESAVEVQTASQKNNGTSIRYSTDGPRSIEEVRIGGSKTRLIFPATGGVEAARPSEGKAKGAN